MIISQFLGLDLRTGDHAAGACDRGTNVYLNDMRRWVRRPGLSRQATLPSASIGLYTVDDMLRAVAPNGTSSSGLHPAVYLDYVANSGTLSGRVDAVRLPSGRRMIWVEKDGSVPAIHITDRLVETTRTGSAVSLAWQPFGLRMVGGRPVALDQGRGLLAWGGVADPDQNDGEGWARTWDAVGGDNAAAEGGSINVSQGISQPLALDVYGGQIAVLALAGIQIIEFGSTGAVSVLKTIPGPGTRHPGSIATMSDDLIYADPSGRVRNLATDTEAAGAKESAIGEEVASLTMGLLGYTATPRCIYSRSMGCYLLASGSTVVCLATIPGSGKLGFSRWDLPVNVDAITECRGIVYIRSGNEVYSLRDNVPDDEISTGVHQAIAVDVRLCSMGNGADPITVERIGAVVSEDCQITVWRDGVAGTSSTLVAHSPVPSTRIGSWRGRRLAVQITDASASATWSLDSILVDVADAAASPAADINQIVTPEKAPAKVGAPPVPAANINGMWNPHPPAEAAPATPVPAKNINSMWRR